MDKDAHEEKNKASMFAYIMLVIQVEWFNYTDTKLTPDVGSEVIIGYIVLFAILLEAALNYLEVVLEFLSF